MARFEVFTSKTQEKPVFSSSWYWLASWYGSAFCINADYFRIDDAKLNKPVVEWARGKSGTPSKVPDR